MMTTATAEKTKTASLKFIVSSSTLLKQLQALSGVLQASNALPILDSFLFEINRNELVILASDIETTMSTVLSIESKDTGAVAIPSRLLMDTLKTFPEQPLTFTVDKKTYAIEIKSDYGKYKLAAMNGEDFPKTPSPEASASFKVDAAVLARAVGKTLFASGNDELRPVMSGVYFQLASDNVTFVATDAHRLVRCKRSDLRSKSGASFIVPKKPLSQLKNILPTVDGEVQVQYNNTNAFFTFGPYRVICRLIDGKYPNYEAVIPKDNPNKLTADRNAFLNSIKRVSIFASKTTHQVRLKISGNEMTISAEDLDFSNEASERLTCQYKGEDLEIGFNSRFLTDMLSNMDGEEVTLEMSAPNRAGILRAAGSDNKNEDILMLVMPVMLNT